MNGITKEPRGIRLGGFVLLFTSLAPVLGCSSIWSKLSGSRSREACEQGGAFSNVRVLLGGSMPCRRLLGSGGVSVRTIIRDHIGRLS